MTDMSSPSFSSGDRNGHSFSRGQARKGWLRAWDPWSVLSCDFSRRGAWRGGPRLVPRLLLHTGQLGVNRSPDGREEDQPGFQRQRWEAAQ